MLLGQLPSLCSSEIWVIQKFIILCRFDPSLLLFFFVDITTISKVSNSVNIERVLSLANNRLTKLLNCALFLVICLLAKDIKRMSKFLFFISACQGVPSLLALESAEDHVVFLVCARVVDSTPVPRHATLTVAFREIVIAIRARLV